MTLRDLIEKRDACVGRMRALNDSPEGKDGDLSKAQDKEFSELRGELEKLNQRIDRQRLIDEADRQAAGEPIAGTADGNWEREKREFSLCKAIASLNPNLGVDAGRELEISQECERRHGGTTYGIRVPYEVFERPSEQRVITTAAPVGGPGGNVIATNLLEGQFIDMLRDALVVQRAGARVIRGLVGNADIPKQTAASTAEWIAEDAALSGSELEIGKVSLTPKHVGCLSEFSRNMLLQSTPDIEDIIRRDFAAVIARGIDKVALIGGGTNEPDGIIATTNVTELEAGGTDGGPISTTVTANMIGDLTGANVEGGAFVINAATQTKALKLLDGDNRPFGLDTIFHGRPVFVTNQLRSNLTKGSGTSLSEAIYGAFEDLLLGWWSDFQIMLNPYAATPFAKGNVQVRALATADVAVRHVESFVFVNDIDNA
jgi:HK97 family phage major capsid protein